MDYAFADSGAEIPETLAYMDMLDDFIGKAIEKISITHDRTDEASASMELADRTCRNLTHAARKDDDSCPHHTSSKAKSRLGRGLNAHKN